METVILIIHLMIAVALVITVLLQRSEGGALGIGGGGGGFMTGRGAADALTSLTTMLAAAFFVTSITLTIMSGTTAPKGSITDSAPQNTTPAKNNGNGILDKLKKQSTTPSSPSVPSSQ